MKTVFDIQILKIVIKFVNCG